MRRAFSTSAARRNAVPVVSAMSGERGGPDGRLSAMARSHPELWAALRPQLPSAIAALASRFHLLPSTITPEERSRRMELVRIACTHPSVVRLQQKAAALPLSTSERADVPELSEELKHNAQLASVGNAVLGLVATEHFHLKYPHLPTRVLKALVTAYVGPSTLADVGADMGVLSQGVQRWDRTAAAPTTRHTADRSAGAANAPQLLSRDVTAQAVRALVAIMLQELGMAATRGFVHGHILSRRVDLNALLKFRDPKRVLADTCKKYGKPAPQSRLLAETGRLSIHPVFVVGAYSGTAKLGEGTGSSLRMAEFRAAEDALRRLYQAELPDGSFTLPSATLDARLTGTGPMPHSLRRAAERTMAPAHVPQPIGRSEVLHGSRG